MAKVLNFDKNRRPKHRGRSETTNPPINDQTALLLAFADRLDAVIVSELSRGDLHYHDIAGVVAHRLGSLMRHIQEKPELWDICEKVVKKQAAID